MFYIREVQILEGDGHGHRRYEGAKEHYSQGIKVLESAASKVHHVKGALDDVTRNMVRGPA